MSLIVLLGPTAIGKTKLAVSLAHRLNAEIISADSRQVYRGMNIGTGKDLEEYDVKGEKIPYHLIDTKNAGEEYNVFNFQRDFYAAYRSIINKKKLAILCGGSGLYLEAAITTQSFVEVPTNKLLRNELSKKSQTELIQSLVHFKQQQHNKTDFEDRERTIRAIEIETYKLNHPKKVNYSPVERYIVFGLHEEREKLRERIAKRLIARLEGGMIEEVEGLLKSGISRDKLEYYGLEYRYISRYLYGELNQDELYEQLVQSIRKFAKKQMTWFRRMERKGEHINWINAGDSTEKKIEQIENRLRNERYIR